MFIHYHCRSILVLLNCHFTTIFKKCMDGTFPATARFPDSTKKKKIVFFGGCVFHLKDGPQTPVSGFNLLFRPIHGNVKRSRLHGQFFREKHKVHASDFDSICKCERGFENFIQLVKGMVFVSDKKMKSVGYVRPDMNLKYFLSNTGLFFMADNKSVGVCSFCGLL